MRGPEPYYRPSFTEEDLARARKIAGSHKSPHRLVQRARLAVLLAENPSISNPVAARRLGMHEHWVRKWRKRWATEGFCLEDRARSGRPRRFSPGAAGGDQGHCL